MLKNAARFVAAFLFSVTAFAQSAETAPTVPTKNFVTVGERAAILYDAPSVRGGKTFIIQRGTPLETLVKLGQWTKVRDVEGAIGWVENSVLSDRRHVLVSATFAEVRSGPSATASLVFEAQRSVLLEVTGAAMEGWLAVRHRDGQAGFVRVTQVWGE